MRYVRSPRHGMGFRLATPAPLRIVEREDGAVELHGERGVVVLEPFAAALIIDRDGILEERAAEAAGAEGKVGEVLPVALPGASGYRAEVVPVRDQPYVNVFALASPDLAVNGGLLVTVRAATPDWDVAEALLESLRIGGRGGANDEEPSPPRLPLVKRR